jgi:recombination protein RecT
MGNELKDQAVKFKDDAEQAKVVLLEKTIADVVQNRVKGLITDGRLNIPADYSVGNALSSAWLILQQTVDKNKQPALAVCSKDSIANALLDMTILGLSPAKDQGYFIVYGNQLTWFTSYFGYEAALSRMKEVDGPVIANIIYEGDTVTLGENEHGEECIEEHERSWANKVKGIIAGAYADVMVSGKRRSAVMTMAEIREGWSKSQTDKDHKVFTGEFAKRTVKNRLMKVILKTSTDQDLLAETLLKTEQARFDFENENENVIESVKKDAIEETGSKKIPEKVVLDPEPLEKEPKQHPVNEPQGTPNLITEEQRQTPAKEPF